MPPGMETAPQIMHWSKENLKKALEKLWEMKEPPVFFGDKANDKANSGKQGEEYYAMGEKVEKAEYDHFENEVNKILELGNKTLDENEEFKKAA